MNKLVPVYPWPVHSKIAAVLDAIPGVETVEAIPGGPGPVLCVRKSPPWACDAIIVLEPQKLAQAVDIVVSDGIVLATVRGWLSETMKSAPLNETLVAVKP